MRFDTALLCGMAPQDIRSDGSRVTHRGRIGADVIDVNRHMNTLGYDALFNIAEHNLFWIAGIDETWVEAQGFSLFRLEKTLRYENEVLHDTAVEIRSRILATDGRKVHHLHEMIRLSDGARAAVKDALSIHIDLGQRKSCVIHDPDVRARILALRDVAAGQPWPKGAVDRGLRQAE